MWPDSQPPDKGSTRANGPAGSILSNNRNDEESDAAEAEETLAVVEVGLGVKMCPAGLASGDMEEQNTRKQQKILVMPFVHKKIDPKYKKNHYPHPDYSLLNLDTIVCLGMIATVAFTFWYTQF